MCILRQAQKRVSLQAVMGSGGSWGLWWQQLEMRKMVLGEGRGTLPVPQGARAAWEERSSRRDTGGQHCSSFRCITPDVSNAQDCRKLGIVAQKESRCVVAVPWRVLGQGRAGTRQVSLASYPWLKPSLSASANAEPAEKFKTNRTSSKWQNVQIKPWENQCA